LLVELLQKNGYGLLGAVLDGESLYDCDMSGKQALVIGSESHGISETMKTHLTQNITIPGEQGAESLNASIAAGILFSNFHRHRSIK
jgi:TrmH family RNA methyltransferase